MQCISEMRLEDNVNWQKFAELYRGLDAAFAVPKRDPWWLVQMDGVAKFLFGVPVPRNRDQWFGWWWRKLRRTK